MRIYDVQAYLRSLNTGWVHYRKTLDRFVFGDPMAEVKGVAVGWMSYGWALAAAAERGCNLFITHEPTFYDDAEQEADAFAVAAAEGKREFLRSHDMAVLRCHDLWDQYPGVGVPDAWARFLGFGEPVGGNGYYRVLDAGGRPAHEVAALVAARVRPLGQDAIQLVGDPERRVKLLGIGTGAITPYRHLVGDLHADAALCTDDGFLFWRDASLAIDSGVPALIVHHHAAEEYGIQLLAEHLRQNLAPVPVYHIEQRCMFRLVTAS